MRKLLATALLSTISPGEPEHLAHNADLTVRELVAGHANTPARCLRQLAEDTDSKVQNALVNDPVRSICIRLLERRDLPSNVLERLACNADPIVRKLVAGHANTPAHCLRQLAADTDPRVQDALVSVPGLPANHPWLQRIRREDCPYCKKANQNRRKCLYFYEGKRCPD